MTPPTLVWFIAEPGEGWADALAERLIAYGAGVERLTAERARTWVEGGGIPPVAVTPQLLVMSAQVVPGLLELVDRSSPWRYLPSVVVAVDLADADALLAYRGGAASYVVVGREPAELAAKAEVFARYWLRAVRLPGPEYFAR